MAKKELAKKAPPKTTVMDEAKFQREMRRREREIRAQGLLVLDKRRAVDEARAAQAKKRNARSTAMKLNGWRHQ